MGEREREKGIEGRTLRGENKKKKTDETNQKQIEDNDSKKG